MKQSMKKLLFTLFFLPIVWNLSTANTLKDCKTKEDKISGCIDKKYYENGNLQQEIPYKNGKREGIAKGYYENGNLEFEEPYKNDMVEGIWKDYYENGNLSVEIPFKNDVQDGIAKSYYENGSLLLESSYKNDKKEGITKHYDSNGYLALSITYQNDNIISNKSANGKALTNAHVNNIENATSESDIQVICQ